MSTDAQVTAVRKFFTYLHIMLKDGTRWYTGSNGAVVLPQRANECVPEFLMSLREAAPMLSAVEGLLPERRRDLDDLMDRCVGSTISASVDKQMLRTLVAEAKLFQDAIRRHGTVVLAMEQLQRRIEETPPPPSQQTYDLLDSANNTIAMAHGALTAAGIEDVGSLNTRLQKLIDHKGGLNAPAVKPEPKKDVTPHTDLVRGYETIIAAKDREIAELKHAWLTVKVKTADKEPVEFFWPTSITVATAARIAAFTLGLAAPAVSLVMTDGIRILGDSDMLTKYALDGDLLTVVAGVGV